MDCTILALITNVAIRIIFYVIAVIIIIINAGTMLQENRNTRIDEQ